MELNSQCDAVCFPVWYNTYYHGENVIDSCSISHFSASLYTPSQVKDEIIGVPRRSLLPALQTLVNGPGCFHVYLGVWWLEGDVLKRKQGTVRSWIHGENSLSSSWKVAANKEGKLIHSIEEVINHRFYSRIATFAKHISFTSLKMIGWIQLDGSNWKGIIISKFIQTYSNTIYILSCLNRSFCI